MTWLLIASLVTNLALLIASPIVWRRMTRAERALGVERESNRQLTELFWQGQFRDPRKWPMRFYPGRSEPH